MPFKLRFTALMMTCIFGGSLAPFHAFAHEEFQTSGLDQQREQRTVIPSRQVQLTRAEANLGIVTLRDVLPHFKLVNQRFNLYKAFEFDSFVTNFHYPYRDRFDLSKTTPPAQIVLHWTANKRPDIPLYTLSAFLRTRYGGRIRERDNKYKNVSNYFLTGSIPGPDGHNAAHLIKLTRGDISSWGDIPRVTAYPTNNAWDDNKYDARGALGIEIDSPDFRSFYYQRDQQQQLHNFILLVLQERNLLDSFREIRNSPHWNDMQALHRYLLKNLDKIDVNSRGGIPTQYQQVDQILKNFPDLSPDVYKEAKRIFGFISGHGIVAREYNERMYRTGRAKDARYDKIDFTEAHVFVVAMDLLNSNMDYQGLDMPQHFDLASRKVRARTSDKESEHKDSVRSQGQWTVSPSGRRAKSETK